MKRFFRFVKSSFQILIEPTIGRPGSFVGQFLRKPGIFLPLLFLHLVLVWGVGKTFGLPRLFWRVIEDAPAAFLGSLVIGMLLGLSVFLFCVLDYSEWLSQRRAFRKLVKDKTNQDCEINNGPEHWTNRFYPAFSHTKDMNPNKSLGDMASFQSHLFYNVLFLSVVLWSLLWVLQPVVYSIFGIDSINTLPNTKAETSIQKLWVVPAGFFLGIVIVLALNQFNRIVSEKWKWLGRLSQKLAEYIHAGREDQQLPVGRQTYYDEAPLLGNFILSATSVVMIHAGFLACDLAGANFNFPVAALAIWIGEFMVAYTAVSLLLRRKGIEILVFSSFLFIILIQFLFDPMSTLFAKLGPFQQEGLFLFWVVIIGLFIWSVGTANSGEGSWRPSRTKLVGIILTASAITVLGLLPGTGNRYLFRSLEEPKKGFSELNEDRFFDLPTDNSPANPSLYLPAGDSPVGPAATPPSWTAKEDAPLIVVCASGGGITAEVWAYKMLHLLTNELEDDFSDNLRVITGASGGMVGASIWVGQRYQAAEGTKDFPDLKETFSQENLDQLSRVTQRLALWDMSWGAVLQRIPAWPLTKTKFWDRGNLLEEVWQEKFPVLNHSLDQFRSYEISGKIPSLIFSPMFAQDGRRLLVSNLDLSLLKHAGWPANRIRAAIQAEHFTLEEVPVTTWSRMGATFPVVSPAALLPQRKRNPADLRRNTVDAGYYDNGGANLAIGWLRECYLPWLQAAQQRGADVKLPSRVIIIELDAYPRRTKTDREKESGPNLAGNLFFEDFKQIFGGVSSRARAGLIRNDEEIEALGRLGGDHKTLKKIPINNLRFECDSGASLSWALTQRELEAIFGWADRIVKREREGDSSDEPSENVDLNRKEFIKLEKLLRPSN